MTNNQILLIKETLLKQKRDIEDILDVKITYDEISTGEEKEESNTGDEMDLVINSNIIDIEEKKFQQTQKCLNEINIALEKIANNTYGVCEESGEQISFERLRANPTARYSIEIQSLLETGRI